MSYPPLHELVPHEPPMLLLERVCDFTEDSVTCEGEITDGCPFVENGCVEALVTLELMAQTIAVFVGLEQRRRGAAGEQPRVGYLVGAQNVVFRVPSLSVGEQVLTEARLQWHEGPLARFACRVSDGTRALAEGVLTAYQSPAQPGAAHDEPGARA